jgi:hypothetical protein
MMNTKLSFVLCGGILAAFGMAGSDAQAQLPPEFPQVSLWPNTNPAPRKPLPQRDQERTD